MRIQVNGKHINIGDALRQNVEEKLHSVVEKYSRPIEAIVTFSREAHEFKCHSSVHISTGLTAQADALANDIHAAYEKCIDKIEKQLRRHKRRIKDHHRNSHERAEIDEVQAKAYVLTFSDDEKEDVAENAHDAQPPIVAEMTTNILRLSVGAAVMHMEFQNVPVLMFQNENHSGLNVVYKRDDGSIGWIDPNLKTNAVTAI